MRTLNRDGFTLIELLLVIAIIAILAAMLLPVLSHAKFRAQVINCTSNFKQWGVMANLYASESKEFLPGSANYPLGSGANPWDINTSFIPTCGNYGLTVPMWFCPVHATETTAEYAAARQYLGHDMTTIKDLDSYLSSFYGGTFTIMNYNFWVERKIPGGGSPDPNPAVPPTVTGTDPAIYGWPSKTTDRASAHVPILSDECFSSYGTPGGGNKANINIIGANNLASIIAVKKTSGHVYGRNLSSLGVNLVFADGHVESHNYQALKWVYTGDPTYNPGFFY